MSIKIKFNDKLIKNNQDVELEHVEYMPEIIISKIKLYSIIMIDPDAYKNINKDVSSDLTCWLHMLIINNNEKIVEYYKPMPPVELGVHKYYFCLFEQINHINMLEGNKAKYRSRKKFKPCDFMEIYDLKYIKSVSFKTINNK